MENNTKENYVYNWDEFDVGNMCLDNSEGFFSRIHSKHEKMKKQPLSDIMEQKPNKMAAPDSDEEVNNFMKELEIYTSKPKAEKLATPNAYKFKQIYEKRKELLAAKQAEEEREMRKFQSRPMPNFSAIHKQIAQRPVVHRVTCPLTPLTLKNSRAQEQKRKERLEQLKRQQELAEQSKHKADLKKARSIAYLQERPFMPKKSNTNLEIKPFRLQTELRAKERKEFNADFIGTLQAKKQRADQQRQAREMAKLEEIRKMSVFKARPNPFKPELHLDDVSFNNPFLGLFEDL